MINKLRHKETDPATGKNLYLIEPLLRDPETLKITDVKNKEFSGTRYNVEFRKGIGRTTSKIKAQYFSEIHDYLVTLHEDDEGWPEVNGDRPYEHEDFEDENAYVVDKGDRF